MSSWNWKDGARSARRLAPLVTLLLLLALPATMSIRMEVDPADLERQRLIREVVGSNDLYRPGSGWAGTDIDVHRAAIDLLKPNAILTRHYRRIGGSETVDLLLVHCTDLRDMAGHYPPNCYPRSGWTLLGSHDRTMELLGEQLPVRVYEFSQARESGGIEAGIRIFNFFVLPDGGTPLSMKAIRARAERRSLVTRGLAQVQAVTPRSLQEDVAAEAVRDLLESMPDVLVAFGMNPGGHDV